MVFIGSLSYSYSQCSVTIMVDTTPVDTLRICLGDSIDLIAEGNCNYLMYNDFNNGTVGLGWYSNATPMFNNPCPPLLPPASGIVCWIGSATNFPRELTTVAYNLTGIGYTIEFDMKYGDIQTAVNCEDPDEPDEGVYLQYSIDGALTWHDIHYWKPNSSISGPLYTWTYYIENVPAVAYHFGILIYLVPIILGVIGLLMAKWFALIGIPLGWALFTFGIFRWLMK